MSRIPLRLALVLVVLPALAACAGTQAPPMRMASLEPMPPPENPNKAGVAQFVAAQKAEAHRLDAAGALADAKLRWRYVASLEPGDAEAAREIARIDGTIKTRVAQLMGQGETALAANKIAEAQLDFLKVLALDGTEQKARAHLRDLDTRAALAAQDRKDRMTRAAMKASGTESPGDE